MELPSSISMEPVALLEFEKSLTTMRRHLFVHGQQVILVSLHLIQMFVNHLDEILLTRELLFNQL